MKQPSSYGDTQTWGQGKYGIYELSSGLLGPMTNISQRRAPPSKAPHGGTASKLHYNESTTWSAQPQGVGPSVSAARTSTVGARDGTRAPFKGNYGYAGRAHRR